MENKHTHNRLTNYQLHAIDVFIDHFSILGTDKCVDKCALNKSSDEVWPQMHCDFAFSMIFGGSIVVILNQTTKRGGGSERKRG